MKVKPLADYLLIEPIKKETTLPSGIVLPDTAKEKPQEGKVLAVGTGKRDASGNKVPTDVKTGDKVMFKRWGGTEIKIENIEYLLIKEEDILAILEDK